MTQDTHRTGTGANGQVLARLALGAGLVLAACGTTQALSAASVSNDESVSASMQQAIALDQQNEAQRLAEQGQTADSRIGSTLIRDSDNPYWTGAGAIGVSSTSGAATTFSNTSVIRDPANPAWSSGFTGSRFVSVNTQPCQPSDSLCNEQ